MTNRPFDDEHKVHRWFGVELNNRSWDLVEQASRSVEETERMIHGAHAACFHWLQIGTPLNHLRAQCLLACVYSAAGLGAFAVRHAEQCLALSRELADEQTHWDRATSLGCAAQAYSVAGLNQQARETYAHAQAAASQLDESEMKVFFRLFALEV